MTKLNVLKSFPNFVAHGRGFHPAKVELTILSIKQVIPALNSFCRPKPDNEEFLKELMGLYSNPTDDTHMLAELFDLYGSDKASMHDYNCVYGGLLPTTRDVKKIIEIGLGTNNTDVFSSMGKEGRPGASLRAFRDFYKSAEIFGADIDKRILFSENRIHTYFVDQTDVESFDELGYQIGYDFDLMIDDGLHAPNANLHSLAFFLPRLRNGGFAVIEDVNPLTRDIWSIVSNLLPNNYVSAFIQTKVACVFVVKRLE